jgi:hypothetical protein
MFYALQVKDGEDSHRVVWAFFQAAVKRGLTFKGLEVFSYMMVGSTMFVRYRTGCSMPPELVEDLLASGRGVVLPNPPKEYLVKLPGGRDGPFPIAPMHMAAAPGARRLYRGPRIDFWERQFLDISR